MTDRTGQHLIKTANNGAVVTVDVDEDGRLAWFLQEEEVFAFRLPTPRGPVVAALYAETKDIWKRRNGQLFVEKTVPVGKPLMGLTQADLDKAVALKEQAKTACAAREATLEARVARLRDLQDEANEPAWDADSRAAQRMFRRAFEEACAADPEAAAALKGTECPPTN